MNNKGIFLLIFFAVVVISFLFTVSAAMSINITKPINSSNISTTTQYLNASLLGVDADSMAGNVSFYYQPWSYLNNGSWILITRVQNTTGNQSTFNATWDTTAVADGKNYTLNASVLNLQNLTNGTAIRGNVTIDNTAPTIAVYSGATLTAYANTSIKTNTTLTGSVFPNNLTLNISTTDATIGMANTSNAFCTVNVNNGLNHTVLLTADRWCNSSDINITGLTDGNKTVRIWINDTLNTLANSTLVVHVDTTAPAATSACSPTTVSTGDTFPCACSTSDTTSGINTASSGGTSTSPDGTAVPSSTGVFTFTCSAVDNGGLTTSASTTYTVTQSPSAGGGGGGGGGGSTPQTHSFSKVTPGAASIVQYSDPNLGLKQIEIEVNNEAQSVKVTVTKYAGKPAEVSVAKTGKVYQYIQINVSNVADKLSKAKVTAKVEKSWVTSNGVDKNNVVISKFDDANGNWNELPTTYASEDDTYYYYDAEVTSFSYFAISEKAAVSGAGTEGGTTGTTGTTEKGRNLTWLWVVIGIVVLALIWAVARKKK